MNKLEHVLFTSPNSSNAGGYSLKLGESWKGRTNQAGPWSVWIAGSGAGEQRRGYGDTFWQARRREEAGSGWSETSSWGFGKTAEGQETVLGGLYMDCFWI